MATKTKKKQFINIKAGDTVVGIFRNYGNHEFTGRVMEIEDGAQYHLSSGPWISVKVMKFSDPNSSYAKTFQDLVSKGHYNVLIPIEDVLRKEE